MRRVKFPKVNLARPSSRLKDLFLDASKVYFRSLQESDLDGNWYDWLNDEVVTRYQNKGIFPNSKEKQRRYYEHLKESERDVVLAIVDKKSNYHIGNVGLHEIDWVHRHAVLGILIGEKDFWGRGIGTEAWATITGYGFEKLNLHRITAYVIAKNKASLSVALKNGYKKEGLLREFYYKNGRYFDVYITGILAREGHRYNSMRLPS